MLIRIRTSPSNMKISILDFLHNFPLKIGCKKIPPFTEAFKEDLVSRGMFFPHNFPFESPKSFKANSMSRSHGSGVAEPLIDPEGFDGIAIILMENNSPA